MEFSKTKETTQIKGSYDLTAARYDVTYTVVDNALSDTTSVMIYPKVDGETTGKYAGSLTLTSDVVKASKLKYAEELSTYVADFYSIISDIESKIGEDEIIDVV